MIVGLLPAIRGGLAELAKTGQATRLVDGYLKPYARAFGDVRYFSYLRESLGAYTADPEVTRGVRLYPGAAMHPWLYAFLMPLRYRREMRACDVLRAFQVTGVVPALIAKHRFGVPFVTTYGFWYGTLARSWLTGRLRAIVARRGLADADAVIVPTEELRRFVADQVGAARVQLVPNGVDTERFRPTPRAPAPVKRILYVGRLSAEKNLDRLIDAAAKLTARIDLRLVFVGSGPWRKDLAREAGRHAVPVEFVPVVDHRDLPAVFGTADVFVLPSWTEGHPKVLLEAMSCALPCIASAVGGNLSIIDDGETGLLFDPRDRAALADRLEQVLLNGDVARRLGARARATIVERYDLGTLVGREIALLREIAARAGRHR